MIYSPYAPPLLDNENLVDSVSDFKEENRCRCLIFILIT